RMLLLPKTTIFTLSPVEKPLRLLTRATQTSFRDNQSRAMNSVSMTVFSFHQKKLPGFLPKRPTRPRRLTAAGHDTDAGQTQQHQIPDDRPNQRKATRRDLRHRQRQNRFHLSTQKRRRLPDKPLLDARRKIRSHRRAEPRPERHGS